MQKIIMLDSGEIKMVENNVAHSLIDSGKAKLFKYANKMLLPKKGKKKGYRVK